MRRQRPDTSARRQRREADKPLSRRPRMALVAGLLVLVVVPALVMQAQAALPGEPAFTFVNDENGRDDQPGQKDLNAQAVATPAPGSLWAAWKWDDVGLSGGNTGDACALFDADTDSRINFAVCVTIEKNPAVQAATSPRVYTCGDGKVDRCTSTYAQVAKKATVCETSTNAIDPFHTGQKDTQAVCSIDLSAVGGFGTANLVNTCSYPSQEPTSAPSDCVLIPRDAFIRVTKITSSATDPIFDFSLGIQGETATVPSALHNVAGAVSPGTSTSYVGIRSDKKYNLAEVVPANWAIDGTPSCTGASGTGSSNGTFAGSTISGIDASPDNQVSCTFANKQLTGAIRITKQKTGGTPKLGGAHFSIGGVAGDFVTSSASDSTLGTVCKDGLPLATFTVTETQAPDGYSKDSPDNQSVLVDSAGTCASGAKTVTFNNNVVPGTINIEKVDEEGRPLNGATFSLYTDVSPFGTERNDGGVTDPITSPELKCTTGATEDGKCTIANAPLGQYWIVETGVPAGYAKAADQHVVIGLGSAPGTGQTKTVQFENTPVPGKVIITKRGLNGQPLAGAVFTLHTRMAIDTVPGPNTSTGKTCTSLADGTCTINGVDPGLYWLVESTTPNGYATVDPIKIAVALGSDPGQGQTVTLVVNDPVVKGTITINKKGINNTALNGATFTLYVDGNPNDGARKDAATDPVTNPALWCQTAGAGTCQIANVPLGNYWVVETGIPNGYDPAPEQQVGVGLGGAPNAGDSDTLEFVDPAVPGTVRITKTDDADNPLAGAEFTLYHNSAPLAGPRGDALEDPATNPALKCITPANGVCDIEDVPLGNYWIVETKVPDEDYVEAADKAITIGLGGAPKVGDLESESFVNERKHRVVVVVCHEGTDTLFSRDVTVDGVTKQSLDAGSLTGTQQKALCDTGGASFGRIAGHGKVTPEIDLGANSAP